MSRYEVIVERLYLKNSSWRDVYPVEVLMHAKTRRLAQLGALRKMNKKHFLTKDFVWQVRYTRKLDD